jgi:DNA-binding response OmpR family regulator
MDVLIVDDDREASLRLADFLAATGHTTRVAARGLEGLRQVENDPPDVIVLDVEIPGLDCPEMADAVALCRAGKRPIPIVLISASRHLERIAGVVGTPYYLKRPFGISQAIHVVNEALRARDS